MFGSCRHLDLASRVNESINPLQNPFTVKGTIRASEGPVKAGQDFLHHVIL